MSSSNGKSPWSRVEDVIAAVRAGELVIVQDDESRENEGDLICAADAVTSEHTRFMAKEGSGLICLVMEADKAQTIGLSLQTGGEQGRIVSPFMEKIDARDGITTGISAADRAHTIRTAARSDCRPQDLVRGPGHIDTLRAQPGGVLVRPGHTEASVDLARLAGFQPMAVLCEILNDDGTMARGPQLQEFAERHNLKRCTVADIFRYRRAHESLLELDTEVLMPTVYGEFRMRSYRMTVDGDVHCAMILGDFSNDQDPPALVRVHSQCLTGDTFGSLRCDCGPQLHNALRLIQEEGRGVLLYMRQEGRGIGLAAKAQAYALQDQGFDTVEANHQLGFASDPRDYAMAAQMLLDVGIRRVRLLTNNPEKVTDLQRCGVDVTERVGLETGVNQHNIRYLRTKKEKMGHLLTGFEE